MRSRPSAADKPVLRGMVRRWAMRSNIHTGRRCRPAASSSHFLTHKRCRHALGCPPGCAGGAFHSPRRAGAERLNTSLPASLPLLIGCLLTVRKGVLDLCCSGNSHCSCSFFCLESSRYTITDSIVSIRVLKALLYARDCDVTFKAFLVQ